MTVRRRAALMAVTAAIALATGPTAAATAMATAAVRATAAATAMRAAGAPAATGHWGSMKAVPGVVIQPAMDPESQVSSVSCGAPGNCAAGGSFTQAGDGLRGFVASEHRGVWGRAILVPALDPLITSSSISSVSCGAPGNCVAGGSFTRSGGLGQAFVVSEVNGRWGAPLVVPNIGNLSQGGLSDVHAVSCPTAGNCVVAGGFDNKGITQPYVAEERGGNWEPAQAVGGLAGITFAFLSSVACASAGTCAAAGLFAGASHLGHGFVVDEQDGTWGTAKLVPRVDGASMINGVSCAPAGTCTVAGWFTADSGSRHAFVTDQDGGAWEKLIPVTGLPGQAGGAPSSANSVSCAPGGTCAVAGSFTDASGHPQAFVAEKTGGRWHPARQIAVAGVVSCAAAANCRIAGTTPATPGQPGSVRALFATTEINGAWGGATQIPGSAALLAGNNVAVAALSCASPNSCAAGGFATDAAGLEHPVLVDESAVTTTVLALSAAKIRFGHEQAERVSVKITPRTGGAPGGKVTVTAGSATLCVITLAAGKGSCTLPARKLRPGRYHVIAAYGGSPVYTRSASPVKTLTVAK